MASNKASKYVSQQAKARRDLIRIKNERYVGKENPKTKKEELTTFGKIENFFHYYKIAIIAVIIVCITVVFAISEFTKKINYDMNVVIYTYNYFSDEQADKLEKYLEKYVGDVNGDGKVQVQAINCSYNKSSDDLEKMNNVMQKLAAELSAGDKSILFLTDAESFEELNGRTTPALFENEPIALGEEFYKETNLKDTPNLSEGLLLNYRRVKGTIIQKSDDSQECYKEAKKVIEKLK